MSLPDQGSVFSLFWRMFLLSLGEGKCHFVNWYNSHEEGLLFFFILQNNHKKKSQKKLKSLLWISDSLEVTPAYKWKNTINRISALALYLASTIERLQLFHFLEINGVIVTEMYKGLWWIRHHSSMWMNGSFLTRETVWMVYWNVVCKRFSFPCR